MKARPRLGGLFVLTGVLLLVAAFFYRPHSDAKVLAWMPQIQIAASENQIDPNLLAGLVYAESRGNAASISKVGALGLCQLMPPTAAELAGQMDIEGPPYDPQDNLRMGARYLSKMLSRHNGNLDLALLSYRLGPARVDRQMKAAGGQEAYFESLQAKSPTPWAYRDQILEARQRFASLSEDG
ncbi:MAG: lytic transglycosylase domain-containing protein [Planctomycetota bacterium]|nr:lytic transglycosylase domain-containing protein [Planctomycetota bacterium]MDA1114535.1 lytic transglycosylase domain-containing protein [Planctomycetota bacterium]